MMLKNFQVILSYSHKKFGVNIPCLNTWPKEGKKRLNTWPKVVLKQLY